MQNVHKFESIAEAESIAENAVRLASWRDENGYTEVPGQCRFCSDIFIRTKIHRHVTQCHQSFYDAPNIESDDDEVLPESGNDESTNSIDQPVEITNDHADEASPSTSTGDSTKQW